MVDDPEFRRWRDAADDALATAELAASGGKHQWACFLCEQAAQLALKGLLHGLSAGAWGHDVTALGAAVEVETGENLTDAERAATGRLARHYIPARYPDASPGGTPDDHYHAADSADAARDARTVLFLVDRCWAVATTDAGS